MRRLALTLLLLTACAGGWAQMRQDIERSQRYAQQTAYTSAMVEASAVTLQGLLPQAKALGLPTEGAEQQLDVARLLARDARELSEQYEQTGERALDAGDAVAALQQAADGLVTEVDRLSKMIAARLPRLPVPDAGVP